jgi:RimJ/RimL family protein N-acetyltransferase
MIHVERATEEHARAIAPRLQIFECCDSESPLERDMTDITVRHVRNSIEAWTWLDADEDDRPLAMAGVFSRSIIGGVGVAWLLPTPDAYRNRRAFWLSSKAVVAYLRHEYYRIEGHVDVRFEASQRWLRRLGFTIMGEPYDFEGRRYTPFVLEQ